MTIFTRIFVFLFIVLHLNGTARAQVTLPASRAVYQRGPDNQATLPNVGNCPSNSNFIQAKTTPLNGGQAVEWGTVCSASNGTFSGQLPLIGGWYQLEVRSMVDGTQTGYWTVDRVGVGEVLIVSGQSNAQGFAEGPDAVDDRVSCIATINGAIRENELSFQFRHLDGNGGVGPTNNKHFYGALGDKLVRRLNVPVLLLGAAIGGTSSEQWAGSAQGNLLVPDLQGWNGQEEHRPYRALSATLNYYACRLGLRAILWFQGESDKGKSGNAYYMNIQTAIQKSRSDLGFSVPWVISQTSWMNGGGDNSITAAQSRLVNSVQNCWAGPNTDADGNEYRRDGTHFSVESLDLLAGSWSSSLTDSFFQQAQPTRPASSPVTITAALHAPARQYAGGHIDVSFLATGPANGSNTVQLLSESGTFVQNLGTGSSNPIRVFLPDQANGTYRVQVVTTASGNTSTPSERFFIFQNGLGKGTGEGLTGTYFPNQEFSGSPAISRIEGPLDFTWTSSLGSGMPADNRNWSARWTGQLEAPLTGWSLRPVPQPG
jgi:hypothetical protein